MLTESETINSKQARIKFLITTESCLKTAKLVIDSEITNYDRQQTTLTIEIARFQEVYEYQWSNVC